MAAYVICTAPRSGSTLLCGLLRATGVAGNPGSHFHTPDIAAWRAVYGLAPDAPLADLLEAGRTAGSAGGSVYGLRLQSHSAHYFFTQLGGGRLAFEAVFGLTRWIWLRREDVVAQAVSCVRAQQTGLWHRAPDGTEIERLAPPAPPHYDRAAIAQHVTEFEGAQAMWRDWFMAEGIEPLKLSYRDLSADPAKGLADVLGYLGLPAPADKVAVPTQRLADEINEDWIARFRRGQ